MGSAHRPPGLFRRVRNYFRHDLREIIAPNSIPDPPGVSRPPRLTLRQKLQARAGWLGVGWAGGRCLPPAPRLLTPRVSVPQVTQDALRAYMESWDSEKLQAELRRRGEAEAEAAEAAQGESLMAEFGELQQAGGERRVLARPSAYFHAWPRNSLTLCTAAAAAKGGTAALKPFLANLYATRAASYRDAATHFIRGYREGIEQANKAEAAEPPAGSLFDEPEAEAAPAAAAPAEAAPPGGQQQAAAPPKRRKQDPPDSSSRQADGQPP